jgi:hypothetical protein
VLHLFGLGRFLGSNEQKENQTPKDVYWDVDYDLASEQNAVEIAMHANKLNSVLGTRKSESGVFNEVEWIVTLMNMGT